MKRAIAIANGSFPYTSVESSRSDTLLIISRFSRWIPFAETYTEENVVICSSYSVYKESEGFSCLIEKTNLRMASRFCDSYGIYS